MIDSRMISRRGFFARLLQGAALAVVTNYAPSAMRITSVAIPDPPITETLVMSDAEWCAGFERHLAARRAAHAARPVDVLRIPGGLGRRG